MATIRKIYLEPSNVEGFEFEPIVFEKGVNFILGERSENNDESEKNKMNGVGKSVLFEIINYCFLKDLKSSRLQYIPINLLSDNTAFCMDLEVEIEGVTEIVTVKRDRSNKGNSVVFVVQGKDIVFDKLEDARKYMERFVVIARDSDSPSLRSLLSIIMRDEKTQYGDIFYTDANSKRYAYSDLLKPHLYLFGAKLDMVEDIKKLSQQKKNLKKVITQVNADFRALRVSPDEVKGHIRDLSDKVEKLDAAIKELSPAEASTQTKNDIASFSAQLDNLTSKKASLEYLLKKIQSLPTTKKVDTERLSEVYNSYKEGLGDLVSQKFEEVLTFRNEIEKFQEDLIINKQQELRDQIRELNEQIEQVDSSLSKLYKTTKMAEKIDNLAGAVAQHKQDENELNELNLAYKLYIDTNSKKTDVEKRLVALIDQLDVQLFELSSVIESFNEDLAKIHEAVAGNKRCQFELKVNPKIEEYLKANYRIKLDGSMGIDHIKTFIYDILMMTNKFTSVRHPGFVIHDNVFAGTGRDDMVKALNYLVGIEETNPEFQYIVTINKDEFESTSSDFSFDYKTRVAKTLTRSVPLLGKVYDEIK